MACAWGRSAAIGHRRPSSSRSAMNFDEIIHYLRLGGVTIAVILAASVVALGVAIERLIALWGASQRSRDLSQAVSKHLLRGDVGAARTAAERSPAVAA